LHHSEDVWYNPSHEGSPRVPAPPIHLPAVPQDVDSAYRRVAEAVRGLPVAVLGHGAQDEAA
jgi:hypothetical protein